MGVAIPQVVTEDRASGAQVIDGSLKLNGNGYDAGVGDFVNLKRTFSSAGNRRTWTWSGWYKKSLLGNTHSLWGANSGSASGTYLAFNSDKLRFRDAQGSTTYLETSAVFRDTGWYHVVLACDTTQSTSSDRLKLYVNGEQITAFGSSSYPSQNAELHVNDAQGHMIGALWDTAYTNNSFGSFNGHLSQNYLIDGLALGPEYFGYTDPLTNTWRPKKYINTTSVVHPITAAPTLLNGALIVRATDASIAGTIVSGGGNLNYFDSSDGINWTHRSTGTSYTFSGAKYLAAGGSGTSNRTFTPSPSESYEYSVWNTNTDFDTSSDTNTDVTGSTFTASSSSIYGLNGFYLPMDGNSPIGQDQSGRGNNWTPVNFGGSNSVDKATGALPILEGAGGAVASVGVRTDAYASSLVLALPLVGSANDVSNQINSGSTTKTVTANGNAAASSAQSNFYGGSFAFDGTGDYLTIPSNTDFNFGTGDFTIEAWVYINSLPSDNGYPNADWIVGWGPTDSNPGFDFAIGSTNIILGISNFASPTISVSHGISAGRWYHVAATRSGSTARVFVDGVEKGSATTSETASTNPNGIAISAAEPVGATSGNLNGYIQDLRIYDGVAKYTSNFIPASTNPDILPDTPSGVSGGSKLTKVTDGAVAFDGNGDYLSLPASADFNFGSGDFTIEFFWYRNSTERQALYHGSFGADYSIGIDFNGASNNQKLGFWASSNGSSWDIANADGGGNGITTGTPKLYGWSHIAYVRNENTFAMYLDGVNVGSITSSATISSLDTDVPVIGAWWNSDTAMSDVHGFISNFRVIKGTALYTSNFTPPTAPLTNITNTKLLCCQSNTQPGAAVTSPNMGGVNDGTQWSDVTVTGSNTTFNNLFDGDLTSSAQQATLGTPVVVTNFGPVSVASSVAFYSPDGNATYTLNGGSDQVFSSAGWHTINFSGSLNQFSWIGDGARIYIYGMQVDGTTLVDPLTPNGDASATNFNPFNTDINTVRGQETGYATLNPLINGVANSLSDGNLTSLETTGDHGRARSTLTMDTSGTGKFYFEAKLIVAGGSYPHIGVIDSVINNDSNYVGSATNCFSYFTTGNKQLEGGSSSSYGDSFTVGDTIGCSLDCGSGELRFYKNGVDQGVAKTITTNYHACFAVSSYSNGKWEVNFGQKPFKFPPPDGFQPLNAANVRPSTIVARPDQYVGIATYTGDGTGDRTIGGFSFKPDLVWTKARNQAYGQNWYDSVRGSTKVLRTDSVAGTDDELSNSEHGYLSAFNSNGYTMSDGTTSAKNGNELNTTYVGWVWKAGGNSNTYNIDDVGYASASAAGLTAGTITPTGASVGTKQGFSIIGYTGTDNTSDTFSHGLSQKPDFAIFKNRSQDGDDWIVYHSSQGATKRGKLNLTNAFDAQTSQFNDTEPTSSLFTIGTYDNINKLSNNYISYIWHDVPGLQKFGSYTSNNVNNGPYVELGFRPALIWIKNTTSSSTNWRVIDNTRGKYNVGADGSTSEGGPWLKINDTTVEANERPVDLLSNGFKIRYSGGGDINYSTDEIIYAAWAEAPAFNLYGAQSNAR